MGFIRELPHDLVSAFKSTLQETTEANLLLHVVDCTDTRKLDNIQAVNEVLQEIQADSVPTLLVYNKIDQVENLAPHIEYDEQNRPIAVYISAHQQQGIELLTDAIRQRLSKNMLHLRLNLPPQEGQIRHWLYEMGCIRQELISEQGEFLLEINLEQSEWKNSSKNDRT